MPAHGHLCCATDPLHRPLPPSLEPEPLSRERSSGPPFPLALSRLFLEAARERPAASFSSLLAIGMRTKQMLLLQIKKLSARPPSFPLMPSQKSWPAAPPAANRP